MARKYST